MAQPAKWVWTLVFCAAVFSAKSSGALPPNACAPLFDPDYDHVNVTYANVKISDDRSACFLVPRNVVHKDLREFEVIHSSVALDPTDLLSHLSGKTSIKVGTKERTVDQGLFDCLSAPMPEVLGIFAGPPFPSHTLETIAATRALDLPPIEATVSDMPGYRRYIIMGRKYREEAYFPEAEAHLAFWCGNHIEPEICMVDGSYDGMRTQIGYRKEAMAGVKPERALDCVRAIGDLFRVDNDKS